MLSFLSASSSFNLTYKKKKRECKKKLPKNLGVGDNANLITDVSK